MGKPKFQNGLIIIVDYADRKLRLSERSWSHIIREKGRDYFERSYDKIVQTLENPSQVRQSTKEKNVVIYEKFFDDFYIADTVLGRAYINVVVNWNTNVIRTAYPSRKKRQNGKLVWPRRQ
jgi:hypothetical protein